MLSYKLRNWRQYLERLKPGTRFGDIKFGSSLRVRVIRKQGKKEVIEDLGEVCWRVVTTVGVKFLADTFNANTQNVQNFKFHAWGTGTTAAAAADTALQTPSSEARSTGTQASATSGANATYTTVATITSTQTQAITEWGLFSASSAGTLWDHKVFSAINVLNGDSIQFTYTLTANSGG
jgi:hypothetical protein